MLILAITLLLHIGITATAAERNWSPQHRPASTLATQLSTLVPQDVRVAAIGGKLVFSGSNQNVNAAVQLAQSLDIPLKQYRVNFRWGEEAILSTRRAQSPAEIFVVENESAIFEMTQQRRLYFVNRKNRFQNQFDSAINFDPEPIITTQLEVVLEPVGEQVQVKISTISQQPANLIDRNSDNFERNISVATTVQIPLNQWQPIATVKRDGTEDSDIIISTHLSTRLFINVIEY